jgi:hypothetical protein
MERMPIGTSRQLTIGLKWPKWLIFDGALAETRDAKDVSSSLERQMKMVWMDAYILVAEVHEIPRRLTGACEGPDKAPSKGPAL